MTGLSGTVPGLLASAGWLAFPAGLRRLRRPVRGPVRWLLAASVLSQAKWPGHSGARRKGKRAGFAHQPASAMPRVLHADGPYSS
jgi:hypothetical protein